MYLGPPASKLTIVPATVFINCKVKHQLNRRKIKEAYTVLIGNLQGWDANKVSIEL